METEEKALEFHYLDSWRTTKTMQRFPWPQNNARENLSKKRKEFDPFSFLFLFCLFCLFFVVFFTRTRVPTICVLSWLRILTPSNEKILPRSHDHHPPHCSKSKDEKQSLPILYYIIRRQEPLAHLHSQDKTQILPSLSLPPSLLLQLLFALLQLLFPAHKGQQQQIQIRNYSSSSSSSCSSSFSSCSCFCTSCSSSCCFVVVVLHHHHHHHLRLLLLHVIVPESKTMKSNETNRSQQRIRRETHRDLP